MQTPVRSQYVARAYDVRTAPRLGHPPPRFAHEKGARRDVPGREPELEEDREAPRSCLLYTSRCV